MINRAIDIIFVDSLAFVINVIFGTLLHSKICNYSWEGKTLLDPQPEEISSNSLISTSSSENKDLSTPVLSKYPKVNAKMKAEALSKNSSTSA
ncbi:hypothetical protein [Nostoc edaphicum]|uniref:Uncharacterized protein n=1 Tax=Nostoc edaphicum CCNP1411 TaxID=1472755 RepID=A0A7D7LCV5_9NOSO|nr:hypothetical protein [Nostoc edaphicum]QMS87751.1 hypothetical protein HUN01_09200 [Nostoc edaphicum CCNP1411]